MTATWLDLQEEQDQERAEASQAVAALQHNLVATQHALEAKEGCLQGQKQEACLGCHLGNNAIMLCNVCYTFARQDEGPS